MTRSRGGNKKAKYQPPPRLRILYSAAIATAKTAGQAAEYPQSLLGPTDYRGQQTEDLWRHYVQNQGAIYEAPASAAQAPQIINDAVRSAKATGITPLLPSKLRALQHDQGVMTQWYSALQALTTSEQEGQQTGEQEAREQEAAGHKEPRQGGEPGGDERTMAIGREKEPLPEESRAKEAAPDATMSSGQLTPPFDTSRGPIEGTTPMKQQDRQKKALEHEESSPVRRAPESSGSEDLPQRCNMHHSVGYSHVAAVMQCLYDIPIVKEQLAATSSFPFHARTNFRSGLNDDNKLSKHRRVLNTLGGLTGDLGKRRTRLHEVQTRVLYERLRELVPEGAHAPDDAHRILYIILSAIQRAADPNEFSVEHVENLGRVDERQMTLIKAGKPIMSLEEEAAEHYPSIIAAGFGSSFAQALTVQVATETSCLQASCPSPIRRTFSTSLSLQVRIKHAGDGTSITMSQIMNDFLLQPLDVPVTCQHDSSHPVIQQESKQITILPPQTLIMQLLLSDDHQRVELPDFFDFTEYTKTPSRFELVGVVRLMHGTTYYNEYSKIPNKRGDKQWIMLDSRADHPPVWGSDPFNVAEQGTDQILIFSKVVQAQGLPTLQPQTTVEFSEEASRILSLLQVTSGTRSLQEGQAGPGDDTHLDLPTGIDDPVDERPVNALDVVLPRPTLTTMQARALRASRTILEYFPAAIQLAVRGSRSTTLHAIILPLIHIFSVWHTVYNRKLEFFRLPDFSFTMSFPMQTTLRGTIARSRTTLHIWTILDNLAERDKQELASSLQLSTVFTDTELAIECKWWLNMVSLAAEFLPHHINRTFILFSPRIHNWIHDLNRQQNPFTDVYYNRMSDWIGEALSYGELMLPPKQSNHLRQVASRTRRQRTHVSSFHAIVWASPTTPVLVSIVFRGNEIHCEFDRGDLDDESFVKKLERLLLQLRRVLENPEFAPHLLFITPGARFSNVQTMQETARHCLALLLWKTSSFSYQVAVPVDMNWFDRLITDFARIFVEYQFTIPIGPHVLHQDLMKNTVAFPLEGMTLGLLTTDRVVPNLAQFQGIDQAYRLRSPPRFEPPNDFCEQPDLVVFISRESRGQAKGVYINKAKQLNRLARLYQDMSHPMAEGHFPVELVEPEASGYWQQESIGQERQELRTYDVAAVRKFMEEAEAARTDRKPIRYINLCRVASSSDELTFLVPKHVRNRGSEYIQDPDDLKEEWFRQFLDQLDSMVNSTTSAVPRRPKVVLAGIGLDFLTTDRTTFWKLQTTWPNIAFYIDMMLTPFSTTRIPCYRYVDTSWIRLSVDHLADLSRLPLEDLITNLDEGDHTGYCGSTHLQYLLELQQADMYKTNALYKPGRNLVSTNTRTLRFDLSALNNFQEVVKHCVECGQASDGKEMMKHKTIGSVYVCTRPGCKAKGWLGFDLRTWNRTVMKLHLGQTDRVP